MEAAAALLSEQSTGQVPGDDAFKSIGGQVPGDDAFKSIGNCYIHPAAQIHPDAHVGPNAIVGEGCIIAGGTCIKNSILMTNVVVKESCYISNSIVGPDSVIERWARIEGSGGVAKGSQKHQVTVLSGQNSIAPEVVVRNCIVLPNKELKSNAFDEILM